MASGIQFRYNETGRLSFKSYVVKRAKRIIYPYLTFSLIFIGIAVCKVVIKLLIGRSADLGSIFYLLKSTVSLWGIGALWFLPTIFLAELLFYIISKNKYKNIFLVFIMAICFVLNNTMENIFHSNALLTANYILIIGIRVLLAYTFVHIGYLIEPIYLKSINTKLNIKIYVMCILTILTGFVLVQFNVAVNIRYGYIGNPIIEYFSAAAIMLSALALLEQKCSKRLIWLSKNSLFIMAMQAYAVEIASVFKDKATEQITTFVFCIAALCIFFVIVVPLAELVNRKLPFIIKPINLKEERN